MHFIYIILFENNKSYIGITKLIHKRIKAHQNKAINSSHLPVHRAMLKYSYDIFIFDQHEIRSEAEKLEKYWIATLQPEYNIMPGGEGGNTWIGDKTMQRQAASQRLKQRYSTGWKPPRRQKGEFKHSDITKQKLKNIKSNITLETKQKMSNAKKGKDPWNKGISCRILSQEHKQKLSNALKNKNKKATIKVDNGITTALMSFTEIVEKIFDNKINKARKAVYEKHRWKNFIFTKMDAENENQ